MENQSSPSWHADVFKTEGFGEKPKKTFDLKSKLPGWLFSAKVIFLAIGLVVLLELFFGIKMLTKPTIRIGKAENLTVGKIVLSSSNQSYKVGENVSIDIRISTGGHTTDGTDLVLKYDPNFLEATGNNIFDIGDVYSQYPNVNIDPKNGLIRISGVSDDEGFNGTGDFATLNLKAKKDGSTNLSVDYTPSSTSDSNIIETNTTKDILGQVFDLDLNIGTGTNAQISVPKEQKCTTFTQICTTKVGRKGTQKCSAGKINKDACVWDPTLTVSCTECKL